MKRSFICFGVLSALLIIFGLSLNVSLDTNALQHEYDGIPLLSPVVKINSDSNRYIDWDSDWSTGDLSSYSPAPFYLKFDGDSWSNSLTDLRSRNKFYYLHSYYSGNLCHASDSQPYISSILRNYNYSNSTGIDPQYPDIFPEFDAFSSISVSNLSQGYYFFPDAYDGNKLCWSRSGMSAIDFNSYNLTLGSINLFPNGNYLTYGNLKNVIESDNVFPYNYLTDTISFSDSHKQSDGVVYSKAFSFDVLFNQKINSFSYLSLSLDEYGGYWYDDTNLYNGRNIDFHFLFRFSDPFTLNDSFIQNGSLKLKANALPKDPSIPVSNPEFNCVSRQKQVGENDYYWDISCPVTLDRDYIIFVPYLEIDGAGNRVFTFDGDWTFSSVYIVTDNDNTPGRSFNDSPTGNSSIYDAYWRDTNTQTDTGPVDWLKSLTTMFDFNFLNPFIPIFGLFTDQSSCADIPIIAGMLHSNETQVCPWFSQSVRNITTPVLGIFSMMLVFGFAVRWLGSRSGNFFEDSTDETIGRHSSLNNGWGRRGKR